MKRLHAHALLSLLFCAGSACGGDDHAKAKAAPAHAPYGPEDAGAPGAEGSGGRPAATAGSAGKGGAGGSSNTNGTDPDTEAAGTGASGSGGGTAPITTGNAMPPEKPKGSACFGGYAEFDRHSAHCGACGHACAPVVRATGLDWPVGIVLDATTAYFITGGNEGKVMSVPLSGGEPTTLAEHQTSPMSIAVDGESVYWASNGTIFKVALGGGTPFGLIPTETLVNGGELSAQAITVDDESVYWVHPGTNDLGSVMKVPLAGGEPITLAMVPGSDPDAIAVDATSVYWANGADSSDRAVMKVPLAGGEPVTIASGAHSVYGLAVDAASVYWVAHTTSVTGLSSTVMKAPLDGGTPTMLAEGTAQPTALAIDGVSVYWTNASSSLTFSATPGTDGTVMAVPRAGGDTVTLAPDQEEPGAIAANGTTVCWTLTGMGQGTGMVKCLGTCVDSMCTE